MVAAHGTAKVVKDCRSGLRAPLQPPRSFEKLFLRGQLVVSQNNRGVARKQTEKPGKKGPGRQWAKMVP
ncbi:hypothetical protein ETAA8_51510 [Anatilimnocola aggregata]|uniref:Uncharacterized protein n=1 Tax=Anatilimnocola aggregata TaxID=2528021 RepID=A0A517YIH8_9BACT|nr:hypothetical protein ETAA8_51510 [Anatilimnocola aggregata]